MGGMWEECQINMLFKRVCDGGEFVCGLAGEDAMLAMQNKGAETSWGTVVRIDRGYVGGDSEDARFEPVKLHGEVVVVVGKRGALADSSTDNYVGVAKHGVFDYLEEKRHDGLDTLEAEMEAKNCVTVATKRCLEVADVGKGVDSGAFVE